MLELIDTHAHLTAKDYRDNVEAVLARAAQAGVSACITVSADLDDAQAAIKLAASHEQLYCTVGVHPHEAGRTPHDLLSQLAELAGQDKVLAIGETGLDYHYDFSDRASQRRVFEAQLDLAAQLGKPVVIHCREAFDDGFDILDAWDRRDHPMVFHCFSGDRRRAAGVLDRGGWLSFTGTITFKNAREVQEAARYAPLDRIMLETDCPYLSPEPHRGRRPNEPALLIHTARQLAALRQRPLEEIAEVVTANSRCFYQL